MSFGPGSWQPAPAIARPPHRHDPASDPDCRAATLAELRRGLAAVERAANALELAGPDEPELVVIVGVLDRLEHRIRRLEGLARVDRP